MANIFVRSTDGSDADNGSTWALAKATLAGAAAIDAAGDSIYVSQVHAESSAAAQTCSFAGTAASPVKIICGNDAAEPPTAVAESATLTTTGANGFTLNGNFYMRGLQFNNASGVVSASLTMENAANGTMQEYEKCQFKLNNAGGTSNITLGSGGSAYRWTNCDVKFAHAAQKITTHSCRFHWKGGSLLAGGTSPTNLVAFPGVNLEVNALIEGVDLANAASTINLTEANGGNGLIVFRNCKLPTGWSGSLVSGTLTPAMRAELYNCDAADTNYRLWIEDYAGNIKQETTLVRTGGASDGTTPISWKVVTSANAEYPAPLLVTPEIVRWNEDVGAAKTVTVEILHDSLTALTDGEVWLEVQYLGTSGFPLGSFVNDAKADVLATAANQATSTAAWTTTGMTNPNKQKLEVTFTPQEKGFIHAKVHIAKASYTLYVDPKLAVS